MNSAMLNIVNELAARRAGINASPEDVLNHQITILETVIEGETEPTELKRSCEAVIRDSNTAITVLETLTQFR